MTIQLANTDITYTALAKANSGSQGRTFAYAWEFDDSTTGSSSSVTKRWSTGGIHTAKVTATDSVSHEKASASKQVNIVSTWIAESQTIPAYTSLRDGPYVMRVSDNSALIIGCNYQNNLPLGNSCYLYDKSSHTISATGSLPSDRVRTWGGSVCALSDGRVFLDGAYAGDDGNTHYGNTYSFMYDPATGLWSRKADRNRPNEIGNTNSAVQMLDGRIFSGCNSSYHGGYDEIYDPVANSWTLTSKRPTTAYNLSSVCRMSNGKIFRGPGIADQDVRCAAYDPTLDSWSSLADCPYINAIIVSLTGGLLLAVSTAATVAASTYNPTTNVWTTVTAPPVSLPNAIGLHSMPGNRAMLYNNGKDVYIYDATYNTWTTFTSTVGSHLYANLALLGDTMIVAGSASGSTAVEYLA